MSRTPEIITSKPLKFAHDAFGVTGGIALLTAAVFLLSGKIGGAFVLGVVGFVLTHISSKIIYEWEKVYEQGVFRPKKN